jgi:hypothetical protein
MSFRSHPALISYRLQQLTSWDALMFFLYLKANSSPRIVKAWGAKCALKRNVVWARQTRLSGKRPFKGLSTGLSSHKYMV